jgi:ATP-dependent Lhr-like helicase
VGLYLTDHVTRLRPPEGLARGTTDAALSRREAAIVAWLGAHGASFFAPLHETAGGGFPQDTVDALWSLVWKGLVTNDTLHALRAYTAAPERTRRGGRGAALP